MNRSHAHSSICKKNATGSDRSAKIAESRATPACACTAAMLASFSVDAGEMARSFRSGASDRRSLETLHADQHIRRNQGCQSVRSVCLSSILECFINFGMKKSGSRDFTHADNYPEVIISIFLSVYVSEIFDYGRIIGCNNQLASG